MRFTKNAIEESSSLMEILSLMKGKTINNAVDFGNEFQLHLSDDYVLRIIGTEVNLFSTKNPPDKEARAKSSR